MYECFHCGARAVIWDADFSFEDFGYEYDGIEDGIVHICHCDNCGAEIEYRIPCGDWPDDESNYRYHGPATDDELAGQTSLFDDDAGKE